MQENPFKKVNKYSRFDTLTLFRLELLCDNMDK